MITKYLAGALGVALLVLGGYAWHLDRALSTERLERAQERTAAALDREQALRDQADEFDRVLAGGLARARDFEKRFNAALARVAHLEGFNETMAESLRVYVNWMLDSAAELAPKLSAAAGGSVRAAAGPVGEDPVGGEQ